MRRCLLMLAGLLSVLTACDKKRPRGAAALPAESRMLALGDSLTAGNGARAQEAWPAQLAQLTGWQVHNAGVSGDTSAAALQRLPGLLAQNRYDAILIGIGGNDMLRNVAEQTVRDNVTAMVRQARAHTRRVALIATPVPDPFRAAVGALRDAPWYSEIARAENVLLLDKTYASVLSETALRSGPIHANAQGYTEIARQLAQQLKAAGWLR